VSQPPQHFANLCEFGRLVEKEARAELQTFLAILGICAVRQDDCERRCLLSFHALEYVNAASFRHTDIQDQDLGSQPADGLQGFRAGACSANNFDAADFIERTKQVLRENFGVISD
jgi:hypothetical protein